MFYPAPVSLNTTSGMKTVQYLSGSVLMQMLATSEKWKREVMALSLGFRLARHAGVNQHGRYYVSTLLDLSGAGATSYRDGMNSGGYLTAHNVEWIESNFPLMYLFRRHVKDGGGAGTSWEEPGRSGAGASRRAGEQDQDHRLRSCGIEKLGQGIFGGYPAAPSLLMLLEDSKTGGSNCRAQVPERFERARGRSKLLPYSELELTRDDVLTFARQAARVWRSAGKRVEDGCRRREKRLDFQANGGTNLRGRH